MAGLGVVRNPGARHCQCPPGAEASAPGLQVHPGLGAEAAALLRPWAWLPRGFRPGFSASSEPVSAPGRKGRKRM